MKAAPEMQVRLLDLQTLDTRLAQLDHARTRVPEIAALAEAQERLTRNRDDLVRAETTLSDVRRELTRAEADVQQVRDRAARDQSRLDSGQGSPKDLTALQHELESLGRRQSDLEDIELEVMERAESAETEAEQLRAAQQGLETETADLTAARDAALAALDAERAEVAAPRESLVAELDDALVALYERVREHSGTGAAALRARRCGGCQLELNTVELARIAKAPGDEVLRCEECNRILVRTPESGLPT